MHDTRPVYYSDFDLPCRKILRRRIELGQLHEGIIDGRDIRKIGDNSIWRIGQRCRQIHLFAGVGGFPLGLNWAGMPSGFSILTGGPPCQPFSVAGERRGTADSRYLWPQMFRFVQILRPQYVVFENVSGFASWGNGTVLDTVVANLESEHYQVIPPLMVPAAGFGAWHRRDRIWILAYRDGAGRLQQWWSESVREKQLSAKCGCAIDADRECSERWPQCEVRHDERNRTDGEGQANEGRAGSYQYAGGRPRQTNSDAERNSADDADSHSSNGQRRGSNVQMGRSTEPGNDQGDAWDFRTQWSFEPGVGRVVHGVPQRVDRLSGLGNAIVPIHSYWIGLAIKAYKEGRLNR